MKDPFWKSIRQDIIAHYGSGQPEDWKEDTIRNFLADLEDQIMERCGKDTQLAEKCGVPFIKGRYAIEQLKTITPSTFKKIFKYKTITTSKLTTQSQFAIYFGYDSIEAYKNSKSIKPPPITSRKTIQVKWNLKLVSISFLGVLLFVWLLMPSQEQSVTDPSSQKSSIHLENAKLQTQGKNSPIMVGAEVIYQTGTALGEDSLSSVQDTLLNHSNH